MTHLKYFKTTPTQALKLAILHIVLTLAVLHFLFACETETTETSVLEIVSDSIQLCQTCPNMPGAIYEDGFTYMDVGEDGAIDLGTFTGRTFTYNGEEKYVFLSNDSYYYYVKYDNLYAVPATEKDADWITLWDNPVAD